MTPEMLAEIGKAVYQAGWQEELANELSVEQSLVEGWADGSEEIDALAAFAIYRILEKYVARMESMIIADKVSKSMLNGDVEHQESAIFLAGMLKGMQLVLEAVHGNVEDLRNFSKADNMEHIVLDWMSDMEESGKKIS